MATRSASWPISKECCFRLKRKRPRNSFSSPTGIAVPLIFIQNVTGYMVGKQYEQAGIIKHGAQMINAVSNSTVPHITLQIGGSYGAGNYGMCGYAYKPRFVFLWPNSKTAVMGPQQLAGVMSIVRRAAAQAAGKPFDEKQDAQLRKAVEDQIEKRIGGDFHQRTGL